MRAVFDSYFPPNTPMLQTEGGWGNDNVTDLDLQAAWLSRYYLLQAGLRSSLNLQMAAWFAWAGPKGWGVIEDTSNPGTPTIAGQAYSQVYNWVVGSRMDNPCSSDSTGVWTCTLTRGLGYTALAVWDTAGATPFTPAAGFTQYRCLDGAACLAGAMFPIAPGSSISIGQKPVLLEAPAKVCLLYDSTKAVKSGSTIAIRLFPCDAVGNDLAKPDVVLHAKGVTQVSTESTTDVEASGNANPENDFRFDPTLGPSGGYIFNLSTQGLCTGSYVLSFVTVTGDSILDSISYSASFKVK